MQIKCNLQTYSLQNMGNSHLFPHKNVTMALIFPH